MILNPITFEEAEQLAKNTDYAFEASEQEINPINWADAAAFFLEGYNYAIKTAYKNTYEQLTKQVKK